MTELLEIVMFVVLSLFWPAHLTQPTTTPTPLPTPQILTASASSYLVTAVVDGDTFKVASDESIFTVRIIGVNTPETKDPRKEVECFGTEASEKLTELIADETVILTIDPTQTERDRYNRLLRYVHLLDGTDIGKLLIEEGYAHEYTYNSPYLRQKEYQTAEETARKNASGFWNPTTCPQATK